MNGTVRGWSKSEREQQMLYINVFRWNLEKNDTDEPICKAEIETQMYRTNAWTPSGERGQGGMTWEAGTDT